jgi:corrinoid protein of di/trimethylamine methyltransferase
MEKDKLFLEMKDAVLEGEIELAGELAAKAVAMDIHPLEAIESGFTPGINEVGENFENGDMFLPELVAAAEAMKAALAVLEPVLLEKQAKRAILGRVVIGTMLHDIHDIGKDMVASMLTAAGFEVFNLGVNVPSETFVEKVKELKPQILGLSALLTTTMPEQELVIKTLEAQGLRQGVKVVVGGAPVNQGWADSIGADGFAENAIEAVKLAKELVS